VVTFLSARSMNSCIILHFVTSVFVKGTLLASVEGAGPMLLWTYMVSVSGVRMILLNSSRISSSTVTRRW
jgi:hypothetical protein